MPSQAGSLELLVCAVSEALAPLVDLDIGTTKAVAANLGLSVPDALAANTAFFWGALDNRKECECLAIEFTRFVGCHRG